MADEADVISAHRMPQEMLDYGAGAAARGLRVIIAGAGGAAHLPGMLAAVPRHRCRSSAYRSRCATSTDSTRCSRSRRCRRRARGHRRRRRRPQRGPAGRPHPGGRRRGLRQRMVDFQAEPLEETATGKGEAVRRPPMARRASASRPCPSPRRPTRRRLVGLDVAALASRCSAWSRPTSWPRAARRGRRRSPTSMAGGRASALLAMLAGVTLALGSGGRTPFRGRDLGVAAPGGRAGRPCGARRADRALARRPRQRDRDHPLHLLRRAVPARPRLPRAPGPHPRELRPECGCWSRRWSPTGCGPRLPPAPRFDNPILRPARGARCCWPPRLLVTGYYPVLTWMAYLFAGMAVGRSDLGRRAASRPACSPAASCSQPGRPLLSEVLTEGRFSEQTLDPGRRTGPTAARRPAAASSGCSSRRRTAAPRSTWRRPPAARSP